MSVTISQAQMEDARQLIVTLLEDSGLFGEAEFRPGSVNHDRVVSPLAFIVAWLQSENAKTRALTDIGAILDIEDETERNEAVDAWARNLLSERRTGTPARGVATIHFRTQLNGVVPQSFSARVNGQTYVLDSTTAVFFAATDLVRVTTGIGDAGATYALTVPMVATVSGPLGNSAPTVFDQYTLFSGQISFVETTSGFAGGDDAESAEDFVARIPDLLTVRNFVTPRAIGAVVDETLPQAVRRQVIGAGDPEMARDVPHVQFGGGPIHVGGHVDLFVHTNIAARAYRQVIGEQFTDTSERLRMFTDLDMIDRGVDMRALAAPGAVLRIYTPMASEGAIFVIEDVQADHLRVAPTILFKSLRPQRLHDDAQYTSVTFDGVDTFAFSEALATFTAEDAPNHYVHVIDGADGHMLRITGVSGIGDNGYGKLVTVEIDPVTAAAMSVAGLVVRVYDSKLEYSIGTNYPAYDDMVARRPFGQVTQTGGLRGAIALPPGPVYRIREVALALPGSPLADPFTSTVRLTERLNALPETADELGFVAQVLDPRRAQSLETRTALHVGYADARGGSSGIFTPDGFDPELGTLSDRNYTFYPSDVGTHILIRQPENVGLATLFVVETLFGPDTVTIRRVGATLENAPLAFEAGLRWGFDATELYDGVEAVVLYETLPDLQTFASAFQSDEQRVVCTYPLARGFHPVIARMTIRYTRKPDADEALDEDDAARTLVEYIRTFSTNDVLHVDDLTSVLRETYPFIGVVYRDDPDLLVYYDLYAPDGRVAHFASKTAITLDEAYALSDQDREILDAARALGVSDRTSMVLTAVNLIAFQEVD